MHIASEILEPTTFTNILLKKNSANVEACMFKSSSTKRLKDGAFPTLFNNSNSDKTDSNRGAVYSLNVQMIFQHCLGVALSFIKIGGVAKENDEVF